MFGKNSEDEADREIRSHIESEAQDLRERGVDEEEAFYAARRSFGNPTLVSEACREIGSLGTWARLGADTRQGLYALMRKPGYAAVAILTLALGIAANAVIFSIVSGVLLKPLSYPNSGRIVTLLHGARNPVSPADFLDWKREARSFEGMEAASAWSATLTGDRGAEQIPGLQVTPGMFALLGESVARGRPFRMEEGEAGRDNVLMISHGLWQRRFGGDAGILGRTVRLSGRPFTIVGVMPPGFAFAPFWVTDAEMWAPMNLGNPRRQARMLRPFGLLRKGVEIRQAQAEMDTICSRLAQAYPDSNAGVTVTVEPLTEKVVGRVRTPLLVLLGAVGLVMLIACSNIASLTLARALERRKEIGIRLALGAGRIRIARQLLTESVVLSTLGGLLGAGLSFWWLWAAKAIILAGEFRAGTRLPRLDGVSIDVGVLGFTAILAVVTGILFGLAPALQAASFDVNSSLREGSRGSTEGRGSARFRGFLVMAEIAICLVLLTGAGVLLRSYLNMRSIDPGFDPGNLLTMNVSLTALEGYSRERKDGLYWRVVEMAHKLPGVESASMVNHLPVGGDLWGTHVAAEGAAIPQPGKEIGAVYRVSQPGYFGTMKIGIVEGRDFTLLDRAGSPRVAIINESLAKKLWPGGSALGKRLTTEDPRESPEWITVAGVIRDVRQRDWTTEPGPEVYFPYLQGESDGPGRGYLTLVVRTTGEPLTMLEPVRRGIQSIDRNIALSEMRSFEQIVAGTLWQARFSMLVILIFACFALLLACIGIYGLMTYVAGSRAKEVGIRVALGATRTSVLAMLLRQGLSLALGGVAIGIVAALGLTRLLSAFLYGVGTADPLTFAAAPALLLGVALLAILVPAVRASSADPASTLRAS